MLLTGKRQEAELKKRGVKKFSAYEWQVKNDDSLLLLLMMNVIMMGNAILDCDNDID